MIIFPGALGDKDEESKEGDGDTGEDPEIEEARREAEEKRKEKHRKMEEERETMRQSIRDKVFAGRHFRLPNQMCKGEFWLKKCFFLSNGTISTRTTMLN